jgi:outer membrane protein assembly factor BamB
LALVPVMAARAENWTQFRGPDGQGHSSETGLPVRWSATENVAWRVEIEGEGWSAPIFENGRLYLTAAVPQGSDFSLRALCLNADDGATLWTTEVFRESGSSSPSIHTKNSHASPTPLLSDGRLYVHFGHEGTACLDLDGKIVWRNNELRYPPVHGNGGSPVLVGDVLVFSCDGASDPFVVALDAADGHVRWKTPRRNEALKYFSFSTPLVLESGGQSQIISPASNMVGAYDPRTGRELWRVQYDGYSVIPRPVAAHGLIFISSGYEDPVVLAIREGGAGDCTKTHVAWTLGRGAPHTPSLLVVGDELYMVSDIGVATCVDARTGEVHWQERLEGDFSASPLFAEGRVYFQNEDGVGYVVAAAPQFKLLAQNDLAERTLASYAVGDKALFIRSQRHLFRIEQQRGNLGAN